MIADRDRLRASAARSVAVAREWRESGRGAALNRALAGLAGASAEQGAAVARELLADARLVDDLLAPLIAALRADPWFEPPFRVSRDGLRIGAVLVDAPAAAVTATITHADALAALAPPATMIVPGRLSVVRYVRAGGAQLRLWQADAVADDFSIADAAPALAIDPIVPADGEVLTIDGRTHAQLLTGATRDVATLTVTLRRDPAPFMREYDVATGALVRVGMIDDRGARGDMLRSLLRHMSRADARDCFDAATRDPAFFRRWSAMREWLAVDANGARGRLSAMAADDPHREVRDAARATLALVDRQLAERAPCPA